MVGKLEARVLRKRVKTAAGGAADATPDAGPGASAAASQVGLFWRRSGRSRVRAADASAACVNVSVFVAQK